MTPFALGRRRNPIVFAVGLTCALLLSFIVSTAAHASGVNCDDDAIIRCGTGSAAQFIAKVNANDSLNGHHDLKTLYAHYGLEPAEYDRFVTSERPGIAYKDGRIVVDGVTVVSGAKTLGRLASYHGSNYFTSTVAGTTYYGNTTQVAFASESLPVMVLFDSKGVVQFAVLNACGNPMFGTNNVPSYGCTKLHQTAVAGHPGSFSFSTDASAGNGAKITKLVYDFGDKSAVVTTTNPSQVVTHAYTTNGSYSAHVTVYVSLPGNQTVTVVSTNCATIVTVALPFYQCSSLAATTIDNSKYKYKFIVTAQVGNGATIASADFDYGDGKNQTVTIVTGSTVTSTYQYAKDGNYTAKVLLHISLPGGKTATAGGANCTHQVPVAIPYYDCVQLTSAFVDQTNNKYSYTAVANFGNGATFKNASFDFGDKTPAVLVTPTGTSATTTHQYAVADTYKVTATLNFNVGSQVKSVNCIGTVKPGQQVTQECQPGIPVGSELCNCKYNTQLPSNSPNCQPAVLPNTGAGSFVALFGAAVVAGFFIFRQFAYRQHAMAGITAIYPTEASPPAPEDTDLQPHIHRPTQHTMHHPSYHQPHRFRPRSHRQDHDS